MAERDTLFETLPPSVHDDVERLYDKDDDADPRDIVAALHKQGLLDSGQLKDAVMALESVLRIRHVARRPPKEAEHEILGRLGRGAMGEVLLAKDSGLNRVVAVKRILPDAAQNAAMLRRFYTEAQVTAQLDHPSIVPIHGLLQEEDGSLGYAMKLVRGRTLQDYLSEAQTQSDEQHTLTARLERFLHVCDAMAYAHDRGIVHRDLKPENIMVGAFGEVLVMDWGIAKILSHRDDESSSEEAAQPAPPTHKGTRVGAIMGTPRYMAPEQATGANDVLDARADQYALGMILYEVVSLTGVMPEDLSLDDTLRWAKDARKSPMRMHGGGRPPRELVAIVDKATARSPDARYASVERFAEDIRRYLRDEAPLAAPDGMGQRITRWIGRHRRTAITLIVGLMMLLVVTATSLIAVAAGGLVLQQQRAQVREAQLTEVLRHASGRAADIDNALHDIEALTTGAAYAAEGALNAPAPRLSWNVRRDPPPGAKRAKRYHGEIAVDWASVSASKSARATTDDLARMAALGPVLSQAQVASGSGDARRLTSKERFAQIGERGVPVVWARVGLTDGILAEAPGRKAFIDDAPSVKSLPWFTASRGKRGAVWSGPTLDPRGLGQVITCTVPWFHDTGKIAGAAALDVSLSWLNERVKPPPGGQAYVIDAEGHVLVHTEMDPMAAPERIPLDHAEHAEHITAKEPGWHEASDGTLAVWSPLQTTGWTYLVIAPADVLTERLAP